MTKRQLNLVQHTWLVLQPMMFRMGSSFYREYHKTFPRMIGFTAPAMSLQPHRLVYQFCSVTAQLNNLDAVTEEIKELSRFHQVNPMPAGSYVALGKCLLRAWEEKFGDGWDDELTDAWMAGYRLLADTIIALQVPAVEE